MAEVGCHILEKEEKKKEKMTMASMLETLSQAQGLSLSLLDTLLLFHGCNILSFSLSLLQLVISGMTVEQKL